MKYSLKNVVEIFFLIFTFSLNFEVFSLPAVQNFSVSKLTFGFWLFLLFFNFSQLIKKSKILIISIPLLLFTIYFILINILYINEIWSNFWYFSFLLNLFLYIIVMLYEYNNPGIIMKGLYAYSVGCILTSILFYFSIGISVGEDLRVTIFGDNENLVGLRMLIGMVIIAEFISNNSIALNKWRFLSLLFYPSMISLLLLTGSRISLGLLLAIFLLSLFFIKFKKVSSRIIFYLVSLFFFIVIINVFNENEFLLLRIDKAIEGDLGGRDEIWMKVIDLINNNFLFGVGKTGYMKYMFYEFGSLSSPHNVFLEVISYTGIIGSILFFMWLIFNFIGAIKIFFVEKNYFQSSLFLPIIGLMLTAQILDLKITWLLFSLFSIKFYKLKFRNAIRDYH